MIKLLQTVAMTIQSFEDTAIYNTAVEKMVDKSGLFNFR
jgi:hypothetical protein